ncbi:Free methionine-R-sulfoxide reductase [Penicillium daleae]|uniref:Free methionine-R-sulfoxide reductase n=1 Tax=Penicillium daleae TaxID=63821 RepID=A0AAD6C0D4_9EURO|nr:Free methionine-R-sulfoxide reductase [Penicillium daleae]KAJ5440012.1 Free methionine-R-sulfoxide reductase [Penicillium daleae]
MPHADSSYFYGQTKAEVYSQLLDQAKGLVDGQRNWRHGIDSPTSNLSNISSLLWHAYAALPSPSSAVNWAGFYIRDDKFPALASPVSSPPLTGEPSFGGVTISTTYASPEDQILLLGPFHGKPACQQIRFGKGVCGTAAASQKTVIVPDVLEFPGHIACDADSRSEIVVPIVIRGETVAIIDIDCTLPSGFDEEDQKYLEKLAELLGETCDW